MIYYEGNELYRYIREKNLINFKFFSGNIWQLVYGDIKSNPVLLVLAIGLPDTDKSIILTPEILDAWNLMKTISEKSKTPLLLVQFSNDLDEIENVNVSTDGKSFRKMTMVEVTELFHNYGLPTSNTPTRKAKNDKESSVYHSWQRQNLGRDLTVSDIDLWKLDEFGNVTTIFELKRSKISIERWQPYKEDYKNFILLIKICKLSGNEFKIAYNYMSPNAPRVEEISRIKVFRLEYTDEVKVIEEGIYLLKDFIE